MRRGRILIVVALILILCVVAAYFVTRGIGGGGGGGAAEETALPPDVAYIVIAAQDIPRGAEVLAEHLVEAPFPADSIVETMLTDMGQAIGFHACPTSFACR
jgi:Flp pilus assembly protein CpaB